MAKRSESKRSGRKVQSGSKARVEECTPRDVLLLLLAVQHIDPRVFEVLALLSSIS